MGILGKWFFGTIFHLFFFFVWFIYLFNLFIGYFKIGVTGILGLILYLISSSLFTFVCFMYNYMYECKYICIHSLCKCFIYLFVWLWIHGFYLLVFVVYMYDLYALVDLKPIKTETCMSPALTDRHGHHVSFSPLPVWLLLLPVSEH